MTAPLEGENKFSGKYSAFITRTYKMAPLLDAFPVGDSFSEGGTFAADSLVAAEACS